jgi:Family of unknown function (DUF5320)
MPFGNRIGPDELGPMTGRGAGYCAGYGMPGYMNPVGDLGAWGSGLGFGRGRGRGHRNMYWATGLTGWQRAAMGYPAAYPHAAPAPSVQPTAEQELSALRGQLKAMQEGINQVQARISELEQDEGEQNK